MTKQNEIRYIVTDVVSIPVIKLTSKTDAYKQAAKPGWGAVDWFSAADGYKNPVNRDRSDKTQLLICWEDESVDMYTKNGGYFGFSGNDDIDTREIPKQPECAAIVHSDACGFDFWAEDGAIKIFVTYDGNGLIDTYRLGYGSEQPEEGETEISFEDLYQQPEGDYREAYRAEIPGTMEYQRKQEAAAAEQPAAPAWMDEAQQEDFREICGMIDSIKDGRDFYRVMNMINGGRYSVDVINAAREIKQCFNSARYEPEAPGAAAAPALAYMDDLGVARCGECGAELLCSGTGDMPDVCPACGRRLEYDFFREPEGPDADAYRTRADNQQDKGTAAEAASKGRETALGTPDDMAGTDATAEEKRRKKRKKPP